MLLADCTLRRGVDDGVDERAYILLYLYLGLFNDVGKECQDCKQELA